MAAFAVALSAESEMEPAKASEERLSAPRLCCGLPLNSPFESLEWNPALLERLGSAGRRRSYFARTRSPPVPANRGRCRWRERPRGMTAHSRRRVPAPRRGCGLLRVTAGRRAPPRRRPLAAAPPPPRPHLHPPLLT